jgi:Lhr-like helicase
LPFVVAVVVQFLRINNADIYVMHFDMGRKWSLFFGKFLQFVFEDLKLKNVEFEVTDNMVVFSTNKEQKRVG